MIPEARKAWQAEASTCGITPQRHPAMTGLAAAMGRSFLFLRMRCSRARIPGFFGGWPWFLPELRMRNGIVVEGMEIEAAPP
ncbi:MAG: hypothetical protein Q8M76_14310 [Spirochaetaceae bacterium]|nr:hypothetical protein [Spirochaetaceae bacterium]